MKQKAIEKGVILPIDDEGSKIFASATKKGFL